jgi:PGF-CTERM protein
MNRTLSVTLAALVVASAFVGGAAATSHATITADPASPEDTATHTVTMTVPEAVEGSWNGLEVNYTGTGADVSDVDQGDVVTVGIDRGDDADGATIDENVSNDLSSVDAINNGETLQVGFGGSYDLAAGDEVVVVYEDAVNPSSADDYEIDLEINYQSSGGQATATLTVVDNSNDDSTSTDENTDGDSTESATATTSDDGSGETTANDDGSSETTTSDNETTEDDSTGGTAPGFGALVTAIALVGAGLLALRRRS